MFRGGAVRPAPRSCAITLDERSGA